VKKMAMILALFLLVGCIDSGVSFSGLPERSGDGSSETKILVTEIESGKEYKYTDADEMNSILYVFQHHAWGNEPKEVPGEEMFDFKVEFFNVGILEEAYFVDVEKGNTFVYDKNRNRLFSLQASIERRLKIYDFYPE
jgi:hypothetical protein